MTEAEWLAVTDPTQMLELLQNKASDRKLRFLACYTFSRWRSQEIRLQGVAEFSFAIDIAERMTDGQVAPEELAAARHQLDEWMSHWSGGEVALNGWSLCNAATAPQAPPEDVSGALMGYRWLMQFMSQAEGRSSIEEIAQAALLAELFGAPFRSLSANPSWITTDVLALAKGIYQEKAFDRMPILADALQDAGCGNAEVLDHCRGPGPHVRGCWVIDLVLGKE
ncbi:Uncharacterized protein OS=Sorangium cellulosum (strain So ce56) GN=sce5710 PE=4 SV=1 [Gemmata massiliana]|uniref:SMI1/KNR4 family protein n=1 Tax=Gemmata massiliana TaxID=1210884 RepID=A0A6P2CWG0_9BACT|nr:hypothetical protein [Gemmata massiliana]VTR93233.1 Uncharacterized protein OS=Sorangium cellulosum (strain So ce56) GN=sce5710 PE=4 SV=1 [Gemmata massiliana]